MGSFFLFDFSPIDISCFCSEILLIVLKNEEREEISWTHWLHCTLWSDYFLGSSNPFISGTKLYKKIKIKSILLLYYAAPPPRLFQVRGKLYELLVNCIPPEIILKVGGGHSLSSSSVQLFIHLFISRVLCRSCSRSCWGSWTRSWSTKSATGPLTMYVAPIHPLNLRIFRNRCSSADKCALGIGWRRSTGCASGRRPSSTSRVRPRTHSSWTLPCSMVVMGMGGLGFSNYSNWACMHACNAPWMDADDR